MFIPFVLLFLTGHTISQSFECEEPGTFPGATPKDYITCELIDGELVQQMRSCIGSNIFSVDFKACILPRTKNDAVLKVNDPKVETTTESPIITNVSTVTAQNAITALPSGPPVSSTVIPVTSTFQPIVPTKCWFPGIMCTSCTSFQLCDGSGNIGQSAFTKCKKGEVCLDFIGCTANNSALCKQGEFLCTDVGIFPDPYDCRKFHNCQYTNGIYVKNTSQCQKGAFDATTATCGHPLGTPTCINRPVPICRHEIEMGPLPSYPNIFFICIRRGRSLTPSLFKCPTGFKFSTTSFTCVTSSN